MAGRVIGDEDGRWRVGVDGEGLLSVLEMPWALVGRQSRLPRSASRSSTPQPVKAERRERGRIVFYSSISRVSLSRPPVSSHTRLQNHARLLTLAKMWGAPPPIPSTLEVRLLPLLLHTHIARISSRVMANYQPQYSESAARCSRGVQHHPARWVLIQRYGQGGWMRAAGASQTAAEVHQWYYWTSALSASFSNAALVQS